LTVHDQYQLAVTVHSLSSYPAVLRPIGRQPAWLILR
jgi:hypothetical protein